MSRSNEGVFDSLIRESLEEVIGSRKFRDLDDPYTTTVRFENWQVNAIDDIAQTVSGNVKPSTVRSICIEYGYELMEDEQVQRMADLGRMRKQWRRVYRNDPPEPAINPPSLDNSEDGLTITVKTVSDKSLSKGYYTRVKRDVGAEIHTIAKRLSLEESSLIRSMLSRGLMESDILETETSDDIEDSQIRVQNLGTSIQEVREQLEQDVVKYMQFLCYEAYLTESLPTSEQNLERLEQITNHMQTDYEEDVSVVLEEIWKAQTI
ncbi:MAG: hypothetical protein ABEI86_01465 [Halobacteriaceae archaeon]